MPFSTKNVIGFWLMALTGFSIQSLCQESVKKDAHDETTIYQNSYAIIAGIDHYQSSKIPRLDCAVSDAQSVKKLLLEKLNFSEKNIKLLVNEEANLSNIRRAFGEINRIEQNACVLIYFAGHGETVQMKNGGDLGFLIPYDGQTDDEAGLFATCLPMTEISNFSTILPAKHVLFLIDACYGGLAAVNSRSLSKQTKNYLEKITKANAKEIITAGGKGERVIEKTSWGHSIFTKILLDGLGKGMADLDGDGIVPATELAAYLKKEVTVYSHNQQTPVFRSFTQDEGDFVFLVNKTSDIEPSVPLGDVVINSDLEDAELTIDSSMTVQKVPANLTNIPAGRHKIILKNSQASFQRDVEVRENTMNRFDFNFKAPVTITSNLAGAQIFVNGQSTGFSTPAKLENLLGGSYTIALKRQNKIVQRLVKIEPEKTNEVEFHFPVGDLVVKSDSPYVEIYINGQLMSKSAPANLNGLLADTCTVIVKSHGSIKTFNIEIKEGKTQTIEAKFSKNNFWKYVAIGGAAAGASVITALLLSNSNSGRKVGTPPQFPN